MDQIRFDQLVQRLGTARSRRAVLGASLAALLPVAALSGVAPVAAKQPTKRTCGPCEQRKDKRRCKPRANDTACQGDGRCLRGKCNALPTCQGALSVCTAATDCCSNDCVLVGPVSRCARSRSGQSCFENEDCLSETCVGYRCKA